MDTQYIAATGRPDVQQPRGSLCHNHITNLSISGGLRYIDPAFKNLRRRNVYLFYGSNMRGTLPTPMDYAHHIFTCSTANRNRFRFSRFRFSSSPVQAFRYCISADKRRSWIPCQSVAFVTHRAISFQLEEVAALTEALKELAADSEYSVLHQLISEAAFVSFSHDTRHDTDHCAYGRQNTQIVFTTGANKRLPPGLIPSTLPPTPAPLFSPR